MDEKKHSRLEVFETLFKEFYKLAMSMDAVRCFKKECQEMDEVILKNPVNCLGHLHLKPEDVMPFIEAEMQKKQERARQLADSIKSLLDEGNYEQWNLLEDGLTVADFINKGIPATFDREPGGLTERFCKELKETKEAIERGDYKEPAGLGPVKYIGIENSIFKVVNGQREECIEVVYPDDDNIDEKSLLQSSVLAHADEILNFAGGDEQMHATEERLLKDWMNAYGDGYRDCRTKADIERSLSGKAKVTFKATFLY